ncbi:MAG: hypothetical protein KDK12_09195, partial [Rhodobacteraceae bacterium]|nr:hypothetical protein [Paracoccaceae bacterium]
PEPEPEPAPEPEPEPAYDPLDDFDPEQYVLRGLAVPTDEAEGFALLETPDTAMVVRVGDLLPEGYEVLDITADGIVLDVYGHEIVIGFQEDRESVDGDAYDGSMGDGYEGPSDRAGYRDRALPRGYAPEEGPSVARGRYPRDYPGEGPSDILPRDRFGLSR